jgi:hypothetical protein
VIVSGVSPADAKRAAVVIRAEARRLCYTDGVERSGLIGLAAALDLCADRDVTHRRELSARRSARYRASRDQRAA